MPAKIQQLAKTILNNPVEIKLAVSKPAEKIIQTAYICYERQKLGIIQSLFQDQTPELFQIESKGGDTSIQADETERR